jgi:hypothetical protein
VHAMAVEFDHVADLRGQPSRQLAQEPAGAAVALGRARQVEVG